jgi:SAM-dependent methyltransferase
MDIGSGLGGRAPYWLEAGASRVLNVDINRSELATGQAIVTRKYPGLGDRITYLHPDDVDETAVADVAIMFDCFEHLIEPTSVLRQAHAWLRDGGLLWIGSIGWYNYGASHSLAHVPIPWCQVLFSERAIIRTIQTILRDPDYLPNYWERTEGIARWDGVRTLRDRPGEPLNMLSLRKTRKVLDDSPFSNIRVEVYGFSGKAHKWARLLGSLARLPVANELLHSYYTALLTKHV